MGTNETLELGNCWNYEAYSIVPIALTILRLHLFHSFHTLKEIGFS